MRLPLHPLLFAAAVSGGPISLDEEGMRTVMTMKRPVAIKFDTEAGAPSDVLWQQLASEFEPVGLGFASVSCAAQPDVCAARKVE